MKSGFFLYCILLLLGGLLQMASHGSALLLVGSAAGILLYGAVCRSTGFMPEAIRGFTIFILITTALTANATKLENVLLTLLHIPLFVAATQALWELLQVPEQKGKRRPETRITLFSSAFITCVALSFTLLINEQIKLSLALRQFAAGLYLVLGIAAWEFCRISRYKLGTANDRLTFAPLLLRIVLAATAGVSLLLLVGGVLPRLAEALVQFSPRWKLPGISTGKEVVKEKRPNIRTTSKAEGKEPSKDVPEQSTKPLQGPEAATQGKAPLPASGNYEPATNFRFALQFADEAQRKELDEQGLMYVRTVGFTRFRDNEWLPTTEEGFWQYDKDDGTPDGSITLAKDAATGVPYSVMLLDADGTHLPHLAGLKALVLPKAYMLPDDWWQIEPYGSVKYEAVSRPLLFQLQNEANLRLPQQRAATQYYDVPQDSLKARLTLLSQEIFGPARTASERVRAVAGWLSKNVKYSPSISNPQNLPALENFLFGQRTGFCQHYATAGCILLRLGDVPTRMVHGYLGGVWSAERNMHLFGASDAHAWTEAYFQNVGWVICDFTPPRSDSTPEAPNQPLASNRLNGVNIGVEQFEGVEEIIKKEAALQIKEPDLSMLERIQATAINHSRKALYVLLGFVGLGAVAYFLSRRHAKQQDEANRSSRQQEELFRQPAYFQAFVKMCQEFGHQYTPDLTLKEFHEHLRKQKFSHEEFGRFTDYHYATRYEDAPSDKQQESVWVDFFRKFAKERHQVTRSELA